MVSLHWQCFTKHRVGSWQHSDNVNPTHGGRGRGDGSDVPQEDLSIPAGQDPHLPVQGFVLANGGFAVSTPSKEPPFPRAM